VSQLALDFDAAPAPEPAPAPTWHHGWAPAWWAHATGQLGRPLTRDERCEVYVHLIRGPADPVASADRRRAAGEDQAAGDPTGWKKARAMPVEEWCTLLLRGLADGQPRTFNALLVETVDRTADVAGPGNAELALWSLAVEGAIEHTARAPILWRLRA
jgi:hypothetical protein